jgi:hypothetical protein
MRNVAASSNSLVVCFAPELWSLGAIDERGDLRQHRGLAKRRGRIAIPFAVHAGDGRSQGGGTLPLALLRTSRPISSSTYSRKS